MWMSNTASCLTMLPVALVVTRVLEDTRGPEVPPDPPGSMGALNTPLGRKDVSDAQ